MRKQRNAAFTDEIITNQKGVSAEKNDIESSDTSGLKSREKNSLSLEYGKENLDSFLLYRAHRDYRFAGKSIIICTKLMSPM